MKDKIDFSEIESLAKQGLREQATSINSSNWSHHQNIIADDLKPIPFDQSVLNKDLIDAYKSTKFHVSAIKPFIFVIGEASPELSTLMLSYKNNSAAYVTAFNPHGIPISKAENIKRNVQLQSEITQSGLVFVNGYGEDLNTEWEQESSYLILGLTLTEAILLGKKYEQNAIVWIEKDSIPELILLR